MKKTQLIEKAAEKSGLTKKQLDAAYEALAATLTETLAAGESVQITGLGTFNVRTIAAHTGRNPKTNETITIPETRRVSFSAGKKLKDSVNEA